MVMTSLISAKLARLSSRILSEKYLLAQQQLLAHPSVASLPAVGLRSAVSVTKLRMRSTGRQPGTNLKPPSQW